MLETLIRQLETLNRQFEPLVRKPESREQVIAAPRHLICYQVHPSLGPYSRPTNRALWWVYRSISLIRNRPPLDSNPHPTLQTLHTLDEPYMIDPGLVGGAPREQNMLEGQLPRVKYRYAY